MPRCPKGTQLQKRTGRCVKKGELRCPNGTRKRRLKKNEDIYVYRDCQPYRKTVLSSRGYTANSVRNSSKTSREISRHSSDVWSSKKDELRGEISPLIQRVVEKPKKKRGMFHKLLKIMKIRK